MEERSSSALAWLTLWDTVVNDARPEADGLYHEGERTRAFTMLIHAIPTSRAFSAASTGAVAGIVTTGIRGRLVQRRIQPWTTYSVPCSWSVPAHPSNVGSGALLLASDEPGS